MKPMFNPTRSTARASGAVSHLCGKAACLLLSACLLAGALAGCESAGGETTVTILYSMDFPSFAALAEETYHDINLVFERAPFPTEQLHRLQRGMGPDLVIFPQPSAADAQAYLLDIGDTQASAAYDGTVMHQLQVDGVSYLLPLPGQYSGYIINETLFAEAGLPLPTTNDELFGALYALKEAGAGIGEDGFSFAIESDFNTEIGMYYVGYMVPDFLGTVEGANWLSSFRRKEATVSGAWERTFELTNKLAEAGVLDAAAVARQRNSIVYDSRMANGTLAAVFGTSSLYQAIVAQNEENAAAGISPSYTYRMLPLLSSEGNEPWLILAPSAYIGVNAAADKETREAAKRILELLSTPAGQEAIMADMQMSVSYLRDYEVSEAAMPNGLAPYAASGYIYNVHFPDKIVEYLGDQARQVMAGKLTAQEALAAVDSYYYEGSAEVDYALSVIGASARNMLFENYNVRRGETELGNLLADSIALASGAPIAVANGGGIRSSLYEGEIYGSDLAAVCPYDNVIVVLEMSGQTLWDMLENGLMNVSDEFASGRFLQVSGIRYTFDGSKPAGERLIEVTLADGTALDLSGSYEVAVNDYMAGSRGYDEGNGDGYTMLNCYDAKTPMADVTLLRETALTYRDALAEYFAAQNEAIDIQCEGRIVNLAQQQ